MGRTVPTFTLSLDREAASWSPFRRALRAEDQGPFDRLFSQARRHVAEAAAAARPIPFDAVMIAILLEQQKSIERLEAEVARLRGSTAPVLGDSRPYPGPVVLDVEGEGTSEPTAWQEELPLG